MKIFYVLLFSLLANAVLAMQKTPEIKKEMATNKSVFELLPIEVKDTILKFLVNAPGRTNDLRLQRVAENIRNFMTLSKAFQSFLYDQRINGFLIQELAKKYTHGDLIKAGFALHTDAGSRWLKEKIDKKKIFEYTVSALELGETDLVKFLIKTDASSLINASPFLFKEKLLPLGAKKGNLEIVKALLDNGANIDMVDEKDGSALFYAAMYNHPAIVKLLIEREPNINISRYLKITPLITASSNGNLEIVKQLLNAGADVNLKDYEDDTALSCAHRCKKKNQEEIITLLIAHGALE